MTKNQVYDFFRKHGVLCITFCLLSWCAFCVLYFLHLLWYCFCHVWFCYHFHHPHHFIIVQWFLTLCRVMIWSELSVVDETRCGDVHRTTRWVCTCVRHGVIRVSPSRCCATRSSKWISEQTPGSRSGSRTRSCETKKAPSFMESPWIIACCS